MLPDLHHDEWNVFGLKFAPLSVPLHRRLQTLAVATHLWLFLCSGTFTCVLMYLIFFYTKHQVICTL